MWEDFLVSLTRYSRCLSPLQLASPLCCSWPLCCLAAICHHAAAIETNHHYLPLPCIAPDLEATVTTFDSPTSSLTAAPFHHDPFLSFDVSTSAPADVHVSGDDGFLASPDPYTFRHDAAHLPSPFGMPEANGGPILPPPTEMGTEEGFLLRSRGAPSCIEV